MLSLRCLYAHMCTHVHSGIITHVCWDMLKNLLDLELWEGVVCSMGSAFWANGLVDDGEMNAQVFCAALVSLASRVGSERTSLEFSSLDHVGPGGQGHLPHSGFTGLDMSEAVSMPV